MAQIIIPSPTSPSGNFLPLSGGTMSGDIVLASGADIFTNDSGINNLGSNAFPLESISAKTGYFSSLSGLSNMTLKSNLVPEMSGTTTFGESQNPFSGAFLETADINSAAVGVITAEEANINIAEINEANISGATISGVSIVSADITSVNISGATISGATIDVANIDTANIDTANIDTANIDVAVISGATISGATIVSSNMNSVNISGATISGATIANANIVEASIDNATITDTTTSTIKVANAYNFPSAQSLYGINASAVSGAMTAMCASNNILYVMGTFPGNIFGGVTRSGVAAINLSDNSLTSFGFTVAGGSLQNIVSGVGAGIYALGNFTSVNGVSRQGIAKINPDGSVDTGFAANVNSGAQVTKAAISGNSLYMIGNFALVNGTSRTGFVKVNATTGAVDTSFVNINFNATPGNMELHPSGVVLTGSFTTASGSSRKGIALIDYNTAMLLDGKPFDPATSASLNGVHVAPDGDVLVFESSSFSAATAHGKNFLNRYGISKVNLFTGMGNPNFNTYRQWSLTGVFPFNRMDFYGNYVFVPDASAFGGTSNMNGNRVPIMFLYTIDRITGAIKDFYINPDNIVSATQVIGTNLYVSGFFQSICGIPCSGLAVVDLSTLI